MGYWFVVGYYCSFFICNIRGFWWGIFTGFLWWFCLSGMWGSKGIVMEKFKKLIKLRLFVCFVVDIGLKIFFILNNFIDIYY